MAAKSGKSKSKLKAENLPALLRDPTHAQHGVLMKMYQQVPVLQDVHSIHPDLYNVWVHGYHGAAIGDVSECISWHQKGEAVERARDLVGQPSEDCPKGSPALAKQVVSMFVEAWGEVGFTVNERLLRDAARMYRLWPDRAAFQDLLQRRSKTGRALNWSLLRKLLNTTFDLPGYQHLRAQLIEEFWEKGYTTEQFDDRMRQLIANIARKEGGGAAAVARRPPDLVLHFSTLVERLSDSALQCYADLKERFFEEGEAERDPAQVNPVLVTSLKNSLEQAPSVLETGERILARLSEGLPQVIDVEARDVQTRDEEDSEELFEVEFVQG